MREALPALACKWPLTRVFQPVSLEVRCPAVYLLTQGPFVLVLHHMPLPEPQLLQDPAAALATFLAGVLTAHIL